MSSILPTCSAVVLSGARTELPSAPRPDPRLKEVQEGQPEKNGLSPRNSPALRVDPHFPGMTPFPAESGGDGGAAVQVAHARASVQGADDD